MKKLIYFFAPLLLLFISCNKDDASRFVDYDFSVEFQEPEEIGINKPYTTTLIIKNKDGRNRDNLHMKTSFSENVTVLKNDEKLETNHIYNIEYSEAENVKITFEQKTIINDTIKFLFSNSVFEKTIEYVITPKKYKGKVIVKQTEHGKAMEPNGGIYGDSISLSAIPDNGYVFAGWYEEHVSVADFGGDSTVTLSLASNENPYSFVFKKTVTLLPKFEIKKNEIIVNVSEGGTVEGAGSFDYGTKATLTATPNQHYRFVGWYEGDALVSSDIDYSFSVTNKRTLHANFETKSYTVSLSNTDGGTVAGGGTYRYGTVINLTATPHEIHEFVGWYEGDKLLSTASSFQYKVGDPAVIEGRFRMLIYSIYADASPYKAGKVKNNNNGNQKYNHGDNVSLEAILADDNYEFAGWYDGDKLITKETSFQFVAKEDRYLHAEYLGKFHYVGLYLPAMGVKYPPMGGEKVRYGDYYHVSLQPKWKENSRDYQWEASSGDANYTGDGLDIFFEVKGPTHVRVFKKGDSENPGMFL